MVHRAVIDASALLDDACRGNIPAAEAAWGAWIILCRAANIILAAPVGGWPGDEVAA